jgi:hypothetical protein
MFREAIGREIATAIEALIDKHKKENNNGSL